MCWGRNANGVLGNGTAVGSLLPGGVLGLDADVSTISSKEMHACARLLSGAVKCWGYNGEGELGNGVTAQSYFPVDVAGNLRNSSCR